MGKMLKSKLFWLTTVLIAALIFSFGINREKIYQSEIKMLILPRTEITANNIGQIIENAKEIPSSLTFYDKLVENNPGIGSEISNLSDKERRDMWNSKIQIRRIDGSGIIALSAFDADQSQAEAIASRIANDLSVVIGKYYNLKTDLDIKIIDGPIDYQISSANFVNWALISLLTGLAISLFIYSAVKFFVERKERADAAGENNFSLAGLPTIDFETLSETRNESKSAAAPSNLPVGEEAMISEIPELQKPIRNEKSRARAEATPEEVKERLNQLLKGNL